MLLAVLLALTVARSRPICPPGPPPPPAGVAADSAAAALAMRPVPRGDSPLASGSSLVGGFLRRSTLVPCRPSWP
jgi:hypothetical protein